LSANDNAWNLAVRDSNQTPIANFSEAIDSAKKEREMQCPTILMSVNDVIIIINCQENMRICIVLRNMYLF
jgi:hypothetical protein